MSNNVNVTEIERFVSRIGGDPSQAKKEKSVAGDWVFDDRQPQFVSTLAYATGAVTVEAELPPFAGGWGTSPDPVQYCLFGPAACFAATLVATAASEGVALSRLQVTVRNRMDLRKQMGLRAMNWSGLWLWHSTDVPARNVSHAHCRCQLR